MRSFAACLTLITMVSAASLAQAQQPAAPAAPAALSQKQMMMVERLQANALQSRLGLDVLESLTTEIGPRLAGSPDEARARDWAMAKLKALGFENVRIEPFTIPYSHRLVENAAITSPASANACAAPPMSFFISRMPADGLMSRPPESKHTPLPTIATRGWSGLPHSTSIKRGARSRLAAWPTAWIIG